MAGPSTDDETADEKLRYSRTNEGPVVAVSFLRPRIAVVLGVPKHWHYPLSLCRLLSIAPAISWGLRFALRFLITDFLRSDAYGYGLGAMGVEEAKRNPAVAKVSLDKAERGLRLTETALSIVWVCLTISGLFGGEFSHGLPESARRAAQQFEQSGRLTRVPQYSVPLQRTSPSFLRIASCRAGC